MRKLEIFGSIILMMVIVALAQSINNLPRNVSVVATFYCILIIMLLVTSLLRNIFKIQSYNFLYIFGMVLLLCGGYTFFFNIEYLYMIKELKFSYWYLVSIYSLPAICTEGGMLTLYTAFTETNTLTEREYVFLKYGMIFYFIFAISVNFLVIGDLFSVQYHALVYNINTIALIVVSLAMIIKKHF